MDVVEEFHNHLDECKQCRDNPIALCPIGIRILEVLNG